MTTKQLINACKKGDLTKVRMFVEKGIAVNSLGEYDDQPIDFAVESGNIELVEYLALNGVDVHRQQDYVLNVAVKNKNKNMVEYLISIGLKMVHNNPAFPNDRNMDCVKYYFYGPLKNNDLEFLKYMYYELGAKLEKIYAPSGNEIVQWVKEQLEKGYVVDGQKTFERGLVQYDKNYNEYYING